MSKPNHPDSPKKRQEECLTFVLEGSVETEGHLYLKELPKKLKQLTAFLIQLDKEVSGGKQTNDYVVVNATHSSPLRLVIAPKPRVPSVNTWPAMKKRSAYLFNGIKKKQIPQDVSDDLLQTVKALAETENGHIQKQTIFIDNIDVPLDAELINTVSRELEITEVHFGSFDGRLEMVNFHDPARLKFNIYSEVGPQKLPCLFSATQKEQVKQGLDRRVRVTGLVRYRQRSRYPVEIQLEEIEVFADKDQLPTLAELRGLTPKLGGKMPSEEYIGADREEWE